MMTIGTNTAVVVGMMLKWSSSEVIMSARVMPYAVHLIYLQ